VTVLLRALEGAQPSARQAKYRQTS
jgi:hypothetical protein